jgi:uncharacterized UPF0160 family protein
MEKIRVVVHDGIFHSDEVFAIALMKIFINAEIDVIRTRLIEGFINDDEIMLIDVGGEYNQSKLNFDHHQDKDLPASNMLILEMLFKEGFIKERTYNALLPLMKYISDNDVNANDIHNKTNFLKSEFKGFKTLTNIISDCNREPNNNDGAFKVAVNFAMTILNNELHHQGRKQKAEIIYNRGTKIMDNTIEFNEFCMVWKDHNEYTFALFPDGDNWKVMTKDSNKYPLPLPNNDESLVFIHQNRFIAVFSSYSAARLYIRKQLN